MDKAVLLFAVSFIIILITAGFTYRITLNSANDDIKALETKFQNLQQVVESRNSQTQTELTSLRRDLEANTNAIRNSVGEEFAEIRQQVQSTKSAGQESLSIALQDILSKIGEIEEQNQDISQKVSEVKADGGDFSAIVEQTMPAVVNIQAGNTDGSGFFIDNDGLTVTNYHVVQGSSDIKVITSDRITYRANLLAFDAAADLALLRLNTPRNNFDFLEFGNSDAVVEGEPVITIGNPAGQKFSTAQGVISSKERREGGTHLFQLDISINPGNSGGPVVDRSGKVIAVAVGYREVALLGLDRVGFAIQSNFASERIDAMKSEVFSDI